MEDAAPLMNLRPGIFLDLGGTLIQPLTPEALADYRQIDGAAMAVALLCRAGFVCAAVTVQSKIAKGLFSEAEFNDWFEAFRTQLGRTGGHLAGPYVCPHRFADPCACKKAGGALYRRAAADLGIDLGSSFVVGDSLDDIDAAAALGCRGVVVRTGWPVTPETERLASNIAEDVLSAARWIVRGIQKDETVGLRPASEDDRDFLYALYCRTMREVVEKTWGWDGAWQHAEFDRRFRAHDARVIDWQGTAVGGLLTSRPDSIYIHELQVLPEYQGIGIGATVVRRVIAEAASQGLDVTLSVVAANPRAKQLYERLGFETLAFEAPFYRMRRYAGL